MHAFPPFLIAEGHGRDALFAQRAADVQQVVKGLRLGQPVFFKHGQVVIVILGFETVGCCGQEVTVGEGVKRGRRDHIAPAELLPAAAMSKRCPSRMKRPVSSPAQLKKMSADRQSRSLPEWRSCSLIGIGAHNDFRLRIGGIKRINDALEIGLETSSVSIQNSSGSASPEDAASPSAPVVAAGAGAVHAAIKLSSASSTIVTVTLRILASCWGTLVK